MKSKVDVPLTNNIESVALYSLEVDSNMLQAGLRRLRLQSRALKSPFSTIDYVATSIQSLPVITQPTIVNTQEWKKWPLFRILDENGEVLPDAIEPELTEELAVKMYGMMIRIQYLDDIMYNAQRQGRISFYMQASGEEAIHIGELMISLWQNFKYYLSLNLFATQALRLLSILVIWSLLNIVSKEFFFGVDLLCKKLPINASAMQLIREKDDKCLFIMAQKNLTIKPSLLL